MIPGQLNHASGTALRNDLRSQARVIWREVPKGLSFPQHSASFQDAHSASAGLGHGVDVRKAHELVLSAISDFNATETGDYKGIGDFLRKTDRLNELWNLRGKC